MWSVNAPIHSAEDTYQTCISRIRRGDLRDRLLQIGRDIVLASDEFEAAAVSAQIHTLQPQNDIAGIVTSSEMADVYNLRMARTGSPGREIYDELRSAPAYGRCPLCGHRQVSTLDHHLPKSRFPALAVSPLNLVPACADCNKTKIDFIPTTAAEETLHPYFDNIENERWLEASMNAQVPASLRFFVDPPNGWDEVLVARVLHHFQIFRLAVLFASQAAEELLNIRHYLLSLRDIAGAEAVQEYLTERAVSAESARINSWQSATYRAFASSAWFCDGGFAHVG